ncbi:SHOCT domain-containing protein [Deinococcus peraridilitoris]|uniref:Putative membrane protein (DUF2078) n=1 Tax=Deinococcus peraridilitoris (strain DSM 19664 / LMG 22246 / CIP 109416 / KR-200) TaxID=937777 RepID=L0A7B8_DEIPD|nr:SHOCT domain-containing protein [Deinococcus peraridilitoris]AFZ69706.1 putative membrane protein (DUF2078) [Deinococcus peraridilitoris DSM 19664]
MGMMNMMGGACGMSMLLTALFWIALVVAVVFLARYVLRQSSRSGEADRALEIARERYARGEISDEEFQRLKRGLS